MISRMVMRELKILLPWVVGFDIAAYGVSLIFLGINYSMVFGLLLGTSILFINLILLGNSMENALQANKKNPKRYAVLNYLGRCLIAAMAIAFSFKLSEFINPVGTAVPLFYPKLIYLIISISEKRSEDKNERRNRP